MLFPVYWLMHPVQLFVLSVYSSGQSERHWWISHTYFKELVQERQLFDSGPKQD